MPYDCSHLFIAIDVAHFGDLEDFHRRAEAAADRIRHGRRAPGVERLYAPGEPEWRRRAGAAGRVELAPAIAAMLVRFARELGVSAGPLDVHQRTEESGHAQA